MIEDKSILELEKQLYQLFNETLVSFLGIYNFDRNIINKNFINKNFIDSFCKKITKIYIFDIKESEYKYICHKYKSDNDFKNIIILFLYDILKLNSVNNSFISKIPETILNGLKEYLIKNEFYEEIEKLNNILENEQF